MVAAEELASARDRLSLVVLGVGRGADMVYEGSCSSSYVLCLDRQPLLLVGIGPGVTRQCLNLFGHLPRNIFIHSNRTHCCGELPVVVAVEAGKGQEPLTILSDQDVLRRVETYRLGELEDVLSHQGRSLRDICVLKVVPATSDAAQPAAELVLSEAKTPVTGAAARPPGLRLFLRSFPTVTTERSCGLTLYCTSPRDGSAVEWPLLTIVGDSAFDQSLFDAPVKSTPMAVVDGRVDRSSDHATVSELRSFAQQCATQGMTPPPLRRLVVGQYGSEEDAPTAEGWQCAPGHKTSVSLRMVPAVVGMVISLDPDGAKVSRADKCEPSCMTKRVSSPMRRMKAAGRGSSPLRHGPQGTAERGVDSDIAGHIAPTRAYIFPFEDKGSAGKLVITKHFRSLRQLRLRASELLGIRPVGNVYMMPSGKVLSSLTELVHDGCLVVTRSGGERFSMDALPVLVQRQWGIARPMTRPQQQAASSKDGSVYHRQHSPARPPLTPALKDASSLPVVSSSSPRRNVAPFVGYHEDDPISALSQAYIRSAEGMLSSLHQDKLLHPARGFGGPSTSSRPSYAARLDEEDVDLLGPARVERDDGIPLDVPSEDNIFGERYSIPQTLPEGRPLQHRSPPSLLSAFAAADRVPSAVAGSVLVAQADHSREKLRERTGEELTSAVPPPSSSRSSSQQAASTSKRFASIVC